jgi:hypothetical protein
METIENETRRIPVQSMSEIVYGKPRRRRLPTRLIFLAVVLSMYGCATAPKPVAAEVEAVGQLSASYHSIAVAPVHASTDLTPSFGAVDTDDAPVVVGAPVEKVEAPEIAPKTDGVTTGAVR